MSSQAGTPALPLKSITAAERQVLEIVLQAIRQIRYGYVQIIMQDGRVVQVDKLGATVGTVAWSLRPRLRLGQAAGIGCGRQPGRGQG